MKLRRFAAAVACALALSLAQATAARADVWGDLVHAAEVGFDVAWLRPLNAAAVVVGAGFFVISAPLVYLFTFEEPATAFEIFVYAPYEYTFLRDLGDF